MASGWGAVGGGAWGGGGGSNPAYEEVAPEQQQGSKPPAAPAAPADPYAQTYSQPQPAANQGPDLATSSFRAQQPGAFGSSSGAYGATAAGSQSFGTSPAGPTPVRGGLHGVVVTVEAAWRAATAAGVLSAPPSNNMCVP